MQESIEDIISKIYAEKPDITRNELIERLKPIRHFYRPKKKRWNSATIRRYVDAFFETRKSKLQFAPDSTNIEGQQIHRHVDVFSEEETIEPSTTTPEATIMVPVNEEKVVQIGGRINALKNSQKELVSIVKELEENFSKSFSTVEQDIAILKSELKKHQQASAVKEPEKPIEYDLIELKKTTIEKIMKICEEKDIDDESDYIEALILFEKERQKTDAEFEKLHDSNRKYSSLIHLIEEAGGTANLKIDYDAKTGQLGVEEISKGFRRRTKILIAIGIAIVFAIGIGAGIGLASYFKLINIVFPFPL